MHIINVNVTTEMFYMRFVCALKSSVCFTLKSTSQFAPSHFKCPVALRAHGCHAGKGSSGSCVPEHLTE